MSHLTITLVLPEAFVAHCRADSVEPATVLQGFVADLCGLTDAEAGFVCNGERATDLARWYYAQVGYAWWPR
jgi:hypothetical protein